MIVDFNNAATLEHFECDVCVVGTGAAGLAIATYFYNEKYKVVLLEAGGEEITDRNQQIYNVETLYHPFDGAMNGRFRVFGGSTTQWGGQSLPYDKIDFEERDWVPNSGWPIEYSDVEKYYPKVDSFLNLNPIGYAHDIYNLIKESPLKTSEDLNFKFSKWSPSPNLREKYRLQLKNSLNVITILNANVFDIESNENNTAVKSVHFKNFDSRLGSVKARKYILACGGLENARLLLASDKQNPKGTGNTFDVVGRFLQDHPNAQIGTFHSKHKKVQSYFNYFYNGKTRFLPRFIVSEEFQKKNRILNSSASLLFITDDTHPFSLAKEIYRKYSRGTLSSNELKTFLKVAKHLPQLLKTGKKYFVDKKVYTSGASIRLNLMMECTPLWHNRVFLGDSVDALGMRKAIVSWRMDDLTFLTLKKTAEIFKQYLDDVGLGTLTLDDWLTSVNSDKNLGDAKHHIGTTRMSLRKSDGVVDTDCRVFDMDNLYIAGSSVFPTSSHSNPTSTLIALAFRLAQHIKDDLK